MGASARMEAAKSAVLDLLVDAYQRRDRVGLVTFRGDRAELVLSPTASIELARMRLADLRTGGATPLAHGLSTSLDVLERELRRAEDLVPWLVLVTDGRANVGVGGAPDQDARDEAARVREAGVRSLVVDTGRGPGPGGVARELADLAGGRTCGCRPATARGSARRYGVAWARLGCAFDAARVAVHHSSVLTDNSQGAETSGQGTASVARARKQPPAAES